MQRLLDVPPESRWPRLMTRIHPRAVDSLGEEFAFFCLNRSGLPLRHYQDVVGTRALEVDTDGRLVWDEVLFTVARQVGKSWFLRELCTWRLQQAERFGEEQLIMHTGKDLAICQEVQRPLRRWVRTTGTLQGWHVIDTNGKEEVSAPDGSRWLIRAKDSVYGYAASMAPVDEGWKVPGYVVDEGVRPTMAEREQPQLWLISTAHRRATSLMRDVREQALAQLEADDDVEPDTLLVEWSAPAKADMGSVDTWRMASPHWTDRRERLIGKAYAKALTGRSDDPDEPDPVEAFKAQWLNQWPDRKASIGIVEDLLEPGAWEALVDRDAMLAAGAYVAVEDHQGMGCSVVVAGPTLTDPEHILVTARVFDHRDPALAFAVSVATRLQAAGIIVGPSLVGEPVLLEAYCPVTKAGAADLRAGLPMLRQKVAARRLHHDEQTDDLDRQLESARVASMSKDGGVRLVSVARSDAVRALVWSVRSVVTALEQRPLIS